MKRVNLETLEKDAHLSSYAQLCEYIYHEIETGHLKPVKARGTNGKKPALYREYHILEPGSGQDPYRLYEEELNYQMSTKISTDYYLRHLDQYKKRPCLGIKAKCLSARPKRFRPYAHHLQKRTQLSNMGPGKIPAGRTREKNIKPLRRSPVPAFVL